MSNTKSNEKKAYPGFKLMPMGNMAELTHQTGYGGSMMAGMMGMMGGMMGMM